MAADNRSIVITLKLEQSKDNSQNNPTDTDSAQKDGDKDSSSKALAAFAVVETVKIISGEISAWGEYFWNKELTLSDDYVGQRTKNIAMTQINRAINVGSNIAGMAAKGAMIGGPVGAIVGAIIGAVSSASGIIRSNAQGEDQQNIMLKQMDAQLQFTRSRAGWSLQAASIGEDL